MRTPNSPARAAGLLFILASATAIAGGSLLLPITGTQFLTTGGSRPLLATGALLEIVLALSVAAIAAMLWPVLRRVSEPVAALYVATRTLEGALIAGGTLAALVMTSLAGSHAPPASGDALLDGRDWAIRIGTLVVFGVSAVMLNALLLRGRLAPPWLAWWGLIGGGLLVLRGVLETYGMTLPAAVQAVLAAPIGLQEMVFAVWLLVKGLREPGAVRNEAGTNMTAAMRG
ncbi:DUF4386 domain-containing protein [Dactylosporangium sp. CS-047395]|uniref:DUF4386 domain-containing protein n=1 Tax=Dactylosporangium sp. CS-047395 TaxID=3239936 RepID=UPI003D907C09